MRELIKQALDEAFEKVRENFDPLKDGIQRSVINKVKPTDLVEFMRNNQIPDDAVFEARFKPNDGECEITLSWKVKVYKTITETHEELGNIFKHLAFRTVYVKLIAAGYRRVSPAIESSKVPWLAYGDNLRELYFLGDYDKLEEYYSKYFKL